MAVGVWGIDIGHCALKALRCSLNEAGEVVADGFDYIEYPNNLSQLEDAEAEKQVREALSQFKSRNEVKGDKVAISVSGQNGLTRFFTPPPVDAKRIPEIVKYEAKQQIPFDLEDVIWDYQQMGGGSEVDGFALETEVGLFAMKRDQVFRHLRPYDDVDMELDIVQLSPLTIYNFVSYDVLTDLPPVEEFDPSDPPESIVVLSMGTDTTDLVITNGFRVWQRSIPIGGNQFTKQLTKDLKLTFAKAEHLKRNPQQADDRKALFQAMRSTFSDFVNEIQRSIAYFENIDKKAKIGKILGLGNAMKLPGLREYLTKKLGYEVVKFEKFQRLEGPQITGSKLFRENQLSLGVCYGLCLQGLGKAALRTSLLPQEILTQRMIREKKPWAVATVGALLLACAFNFFFQYRAWYTAHEERVVEDVSWKAAISAIDQNKGTSDRFVNEDNELVTELERVEAIGNEVVGSADRRLLWLELLKAIDSALPRDPKRDPRIIPDPTVIPFEDRPEIIIDYVESQYYPDLSEWFTDAVKQKYIEGLAGGVALPKKAAPAEPPPEEGTPPAAGTPDPAVAAVPPVADEETEITGPQEVNGEKGGWVIEIGGHHFHNSGPPNWGGAYVRRTFLRNLENGSVVLPISPTEEEEFTYKELGIRYPILAHEEKIDKRFTIANPYYKNENMGPGETPQEDVNNPQNFMVPICRFKVQFCWQDMPLSIRMKIKEEQEAAPPPDENLAARPTTGGGT